MGSYNYVNVQSKRYSTFRLFHIVDRKIKIVECDAEKASSWLRHYQSNEHPYLIYAYIKESDRWVRTEHYRNTSVLDVAMDKLPIVYDDRMFKAPSSREPVSDQITLAC